MFRIISKGEIELDAEVPEAQLNKIKEGQAARVTGRRRPRMHRARFA